MAALERIAAHLGAVFAAHVAFQFMNRRGLWSPHDVQRYGLVGVAAKAADFEISEASVESITERWRRLRRSFVTKHPLIPCFTGKAVGFLAGLPGPFSRRPDPAQCSRDKPDLSGELEASHPFRGCCCRDLRPHSVYHRVLLVDGELTFGVQLISPKTFRGAAGSSPRPSASAGQPDRDGPGATKCQAEPNRLSSLTENRLSWCAI